MADRRVPIFQAWQLDVDPTLSDEKVDLPSPGVWRWLGHRKTLGRYDIKGRAGDRVAPRALGRAMRGYSAKTEQTVRRPTNLGRGGKSSLGVRCIGGDYEPAAGLAAECRGAVTPERREELRTRLLAEAGTGIQQLAGTRRFAAAAKVTGLGEGEGAVVRVEWVAFGAERERGVRSPYANRKARSFKAGVAKVSEQLGKAFGETARGAEVEAPGPADARLPGLLGTPVHDSLGDRLDVIGENAAQNIRKRAERKAKQHKLDRLSEQDLRRFLDNGDNPFEEMPGGPGHDGEALSRWWAEHSDRILLRTAVEGTLAAKAEKEFTDLAQREVGRRGELSPNPLAAVRGARGKTFAAEVERRAAVRAGELAALPEKDRMARTRELHERIKGVGLNGASREDLAESVALQHLRNAHNEHEAQMVEPQPELGHGGVGIGID